MVSQTEQIFLPRKKYIPCEKSNTSYMYRFGRRASDIRDEDLYHLTRTTKHVEEVLLGDTYVTAEGIRYICRLQNVRILDLRNLPIDDTIVDDLLLLTDLEYLYIKYTAISSNGLYRLLKGLKKLQIIVHRLEDPFSEKIILQQLKREFTNCNLKLG